MAIDQAELGAQATRVGTNGTLYYLLKPLADGIFALAILNRDDNAIVANTKKLNYYGIGHVAKACDHWRYQDIKDFGKKTDFTIAPGQTH